MNLLDNLSYESMALFANYQRKENYNGYIIISSVLAIMSTVANAFMVVTNVAVSSLMGRFLYERAKKFSFYIFLNAIIIGLIIFIPILCLKKQIISILVKEGPISVVANEIYFFMLFLIFVEISCSIFYANFISVGKFYLALLLFFIFTCVNVLLIYIFL